MKNWTQILVFVILALVLGFILGRVTKSGHEKGKHRIEKRIIMSDDPDAIKHLETEGDISIQIDSDGDMQTVIASFEDSGFEGDTTFQMGGNTIHINRTGDEMRVEVESEQEIEASANQKKLRIEKEIVLD